MVDRGIMFLWTYWYYTPGESPILPEMGRDTSKMKITLAMALPCKAKMTAQ
jgi:hypothetical protein